MFLCVDGIMHADELIDIGNVDDDIMNVNKSSNGMSNILEGQMTINDINGEDKSENLNVETNIVNDNEKRYSMCRDKVDNSDFYDAVKQQLNKKRFTEDNVNLSQININSAENEKQVVQSMDTEIISCEKSNLAEFSKIAEDTMPPPHAPLQQSLQVCNYFATTF